MNNEAPAALHDRIADLEQQLKLADEGASRLAERCLTLEQEVQSYLSAHPKKEERTESKALRQPKLYYDCGFGFSEADTLMSDDCVYDPLNGTVGASFKLPTDIQVIRFDPGELPCCISGLSFSDDRIQALPCNGIVLQEDNTLFLRGDPNYRLDGVNNYPAGTLLVIRYSYYPLEALSDDPLFRIVLDGMKQFQQEKSGEENHIQELNRIINDQQRTIEQLQRSVANLNHDILDLRQTNNALQSSNEAYDNALKGMQTSTIWKLTAPLRKLLGLFHHSF